MLAHTQLKFRTHFLGKQTSEVGHRHNCNRKTRAWIGSLPRKRYSVSYFWLFACKQLQSCRLRHCYQFSWEAVSNSHRIAIYKFWIGITDLWSWWFSLWIGSIWFFSCGLGLEFQCLYQLITLDSLRGSLGRCVQMRRIRSPETDGPTWEPQTNPEASHGSSLTIRANLFEKIK